MSSSSTQDFFSTYLSYTDGGEVPVTFSRWSAIVGISALLERNAWAEFGNADIYPNIYSMFIGTAGTRKSTAIKLIKKLMIKAGYSTIAAERTSKEKFLRDMSRASGEGTDILETNLFSNDSDDTSASPMFIAADEANDFFGICNGDFLSILGSLWDWEGKYENRIKTGNSDWINNPTITILAGNTPTGFSKGFPPEIVGQGFLSRLLLIYGEPNGKRITIPRRPEIAETAEIVRLLQVIKANTTGVYKFTPTGYNLFDKIYQTYKPIDDPKFESYSNRRDVHLLKICLVVAAARLEKDIGEITVIQANTYLSYIEALMPKALGEFGKAKSADVAHKVVEYIYSEERVVTLKDIWKQVSSDLESMKDLGVIITKLQFADKIQIIPTGFLPLRKEVGEIEATDDGLIDYKMFLTNEELQVKK